MKIKIVFLALLVSYISNAQHWAVRQELCLTSGKAQFVSNTSPYRPFRPTYAQDPDIYLHIDYYPKQQKNRYTFTIGTYHTSFSATDNATKGNGYLGFLFPSKFLTEGTLGSVYIGLSYSKSILPTTFKNQILISGGMQYFFIRPIGTGSAGGPFGSFVLQNTEMTRTIRSHPGWHTGLVYLIKNKKHREVLQFSAKYVGTFNTTQFTNDYFYSQITPTDPPEILQNQVMRFRLTGASIQLGVGKTMHYFPRQRKRTVGS